VFARLSHLTEMTSYEHGVPSWVDIGMPDPVAGMRFYAQLFGWEGQDLGKEAGHYTIASKGAKQVGAFIWSELSTSDLAKSKAFYTAVFGWGWGCVDEHTEAQVGGRTIGGVMPRRPDMPAEVPDNWLVYFGADDVNADAKKGVELGRPWSLVRPISRGQGALPCAWIPRGVVFALFKG